MTGTTCPRCGKQININVNELVSSNTKRRGNKNGVIKCPHCNALISIGIDRNNKIRNRTLVDLYDKKLKDNESLKEKLIELEENNKLLLKELEKPKTKVISGESLLIEFINAIKKIDFDNTPIIKDELALEREWNYLKRIKEEVNDEINKFTYSITELINGENINSIINGIRVVYPLKIIKDYLMNKEDKRFNNINQIIEKTISNKQQTLNKIIELESRDKNFINDQITSLERIINELSNSLKENKNTLKQFNDYLDTELARIDILSYKWSETKSDYSRISELKELIGNFFTDISIVKTIIDTHWKDGKFTYDDLFTEINDLPDYFKPEKDEREVVQKLNNVIKQLGIDTTKDITTQLEEIKNNFIMGIDGFNDYSKIINAYEEQIKTLEEELELLKNKKIDFNEELKQALTSKGIKKSRLEKELIKKGELVKGSNYKIIKNNNDLILYYNGKLTLYSVISSGYSLMNKALTSDDKELNIIIEAGDDIKEAITSFITKTKEYADNRLRVLEEAASNYVGKNYKQFKKENKELAKTLNNDEKTLIRHIIEDPTREKNKAIKSTVKNVLIRGVEATLAAILGLPRIGLASRYYSLRNESITRMNEIAQHEKIFNESIENGDARKVIDTIDLYEYLVLGVKDPGMSPEGIDEERMFSDPSYAWYVGNPTIDEKAVGIDINGDGVMGTVDNPFYKDGGNWDESQRQGINQLIQHYNDLNDKNDYTLSTNLLHNITHFNQLNQVSRTYTETMITATIVGALLTYEGVKAVKKLIEKRKYGPLGRFDITKFVDKKINIK